jgi:UDPglucose--hexose-1-phosphate uridylyltransferase
VTPDGGLGTPAGSPVKRTAAHLADGREIVYFDSDDAAVRRFDDPRRLPAISTSSALRWDAAVEEWVVIAGHRQTRTFLPPADECPLCPSRDGRHTEVPSRDYEVVVFENRFPSLSMAAAPDGEVADPERERPGIGRCEVVCFTPDHDASFSSLSPRQARTVLEAWVDRTVELSALPGVVQVFPFENRGEEIGVTLGHPHGQVYAYPFVPPRAARLLAAERRHHAATGRHLSDDLLAEECADGRRVVAADDSWVAFVPVAARWPFEVHLYPRRRVPDLPSLSEQERAAFGPLYLDVLRRLDGLFGLPMPYVSAWHQAPSTAGPGEAALHLTLFSTRRGPGKLKFLAGSESAAGVFINDIPPELAAQMLRDAP